MQPLVKEEIMEEEQKRKKVGARGIDIRNNKSI
jgi:hypothetical protein